MLLRQQDRARKHEDAAMLVGIPIGLDPKRRSEDGDRLDGAGIASPNDLAVSTCGGCNSSLLIG